LNAINLSLPVIRFVAEKLPPGHVLKKAALSVAEESFEYEKRLFERGQSRYSRSHGYPVR